MKSFRDYLELSNSCSYDVDDVIGRADRFGFQNFCSPGCGYSLVSPQHGNSNEYLQYMFLWKNMENYP